MNSPSLYRRWAISRGMGSNDVVRDANHLLVIIDRAHRLEASSQTPGQLIGNSRVSYKLPPLSHDLDDSLRKLIRIT